MKCLKQSTQTDVTIGPIWATADGALKADLAYDASGINCDVYKGGTKADVTLANSSGDGYFRAGSGEAQYLLTLSTGHTDTLGRLRLTLSATGYYMKPEDFMVLPANVYDALFGSDVLQVDLKQILGTALTETSAGYLTAAFKKLFDVETPTLTADVDFATDAEVAAAVVAAISEEGVVDESALAAAVVTALGALTITVQSPVASSGTITIYQGDDYVAAEGTSIAVTVAVSGAPDLTGATVHLKLTQATWEATSCTSDGTDWTIVFEPDAADTAALSGGSQLYEVEATLASGSVRTLAKGVCMVEKDIPAV